MDQVGRRELPLEPRQLDRGRVVQLGIVDLTLASFRVRAALYGALGVACSRGLARLPCVSLAKSTPSPPFDIARPTRDPRLSFVALVDGRVVGFASVDVIGDNGYHGLTAAVREHRRRGIARAVKQHQIATARMLGIQRLVTESEERNEPMRRLNASLGYRPIPGWSFLPVPAGLASARTRTGGSN